MPIVGNTEPTQVKVYFTAATYDDATKVLEWCEKAKKEHPNIVLDVEVRKG